MSINMICNFVISNFSIYIDRKTFVEKLLVTIEKNYYYSVLVTF